MRSSAVEANVIQRGVHYGQHGGFVLLLLSLLRLALALDVHSMRTLVRLNIYKSASLVSDCVEFCSSGTAVCCSFHDGLLEVCVYRCAFALQDYVGGMNRNISRELIQMLEMFMDLSLAISSEGRMFGVQPNVSISSAS